jgi:hypothetical protein
MYTSGRGWVVNANPRPLYPRERLGTHCTGGWVGPRAPTGIRSTDRPARSQSLYRLSYPAHVRVDMILNYLLSILFLQSRIKLFSGGLKVKDIFRNWLEIFIEICTHFMFVTLNLFTFSLRRQKA